MDLLLVVVGEADELVEEGPGEPAWSDIDTTEWWRNDVIDWLGLLLICVCFFVENGNMLQVWRVMLQVWRDM